MRRLSPLLEKLGVLGAALGTLCCIGIPAIVAAISAIGLGFIIRDAVLRQLTLASLAIGYAGMFLSWRQHRSPGPLLLYVGSGALVYTCVFVWFSRFGAYLGLIGMLTGAVWSALARRACPLPSHAEVEPAAETDGPQMNSDPET